jgi:hypothetical protein
VSLANKYSVPAVGVLVQVPLEVALMRNAARPTDELVDEGAIRSVYSMLEPPSLDEGFHEIMLVESPADDVG